VATAAQSAISRISGVALVERRAVRTRIVAHPENGGEALAGARGKQRRGAREKRGRGHGVAKEREAHGAAAKSGRTSKRLRVSAPALRTSWSVIAGVVRFVVSHTSPALAQTLY